MLRKTKRKQVCTLRPKNFKYLPSDPGSYREVKENKTYKCNKGKIN